MEYTVFFVIGVAIVGSTIFIGISQNRKKKPKDPVKPPVDPPVPPIDPPIDIPIPPPELPKEEFRLKWKDRRPIGMIMLGNWRPSAVPPNHRNWFLQGTYDFHDFETALFEHARVCIKNLKWMNAQGMITWDMEGQKYPHSITYVGSPDLVGSFAPEMDAVVDRYFKMFSDAGFRTGVCLRPTIIKNLDTWPGQFVDDPYEVLHRKMTYAKNRWGTTIFYVDSNVGVGLDKGSDNTAGYGHLLPADIFKRLAEAFPDCLIIPEHRDFEYFKYTAPFCSWNNKDAPILSDLHRSMLPDSFLVGAVNSETPQLEEAVKQGNVLLFSAWWDDPNNQKIKQAYEQA